MPCFLFPSQSQCLSAVTDSNKNLFSLHQIKLCVKISVKNHQIFYSKFSAPADKEECRSSSISFTQSKDFCFLFFFLSQSESNVLLFCLSRVQNPNRSFIFSCLELLSARIFFLLSPYPAAGFQWSF